MVGDLPGITARLHYIADLGVQAVWLSPFYRSPMSDFGYDVSDYCDVDPLFGTLDDFDALLARARELELEVIVDFVPNHSSDQHPWFAESRSSTENAGFALPAAVPWLRIATDHALRNVEMQQADEGSMLAFTRALLHLRQGSAALWIGSYTSIDVRDDRVLAYQRSSGDEHIVYVLNLSAQIVMLDVPGEILLRTSADAVLRETDGSLVLAGNAGAVLRPSGPTALRPARPQLTE